MIWNDLARESKLLFSFVFLSWILIGVLLLLSPVDIDFISFAPLLVLPVILYVAAYYYLWRDEKTLSAMCEMIAAGWLLLIPVLASTYLAMSIGMPLADQELMAMDKAIGFNWYAFINAVDQFSLLAKVLDFSYITFGYQMFIVPLLLVKVKKFNRAYAFILGYGLLCYISSFIAIWYPALGTYAIMGMDQTNFQNINVQYAYHFLESFNAVRTGEPFVLALGVASGILTFPSVHAGVAFLIIWAMWDVKFLRYPFLVLNILMAVSAVSHSNHYLVDIIMGAGVTGLTVSIVSYLFLNSKIKLLIRQPAEALS